MPSSPLWCLHTHIQGSLKSKYKLLVACGSWGSFPPLHLGASSSPWWKSGAAPNSSMVLERLLVQGRPPCPLATFAGVALHPELCLPLCGGPAVSFEQLRLAPIPGRSFGFASGSYRASGSTAGSWMRGKGWIWAPIPSAAGCAGGPHVLGCSCWPGVPGEGEEPV